MTPSLRISQKLINRLANVNANNVGKIYGILAKNTLVVLALELELEDSTESDLINSFPAEIDVRGIISIGDGTYNDQTIKESLSQIYVTDNPLFINYKRENNDITTTFYVNSQLEACKFTPITEQDILAQFLYVRLLADVPLSCEVGPETIKDGFLNLRKSIASGVMAFKFSKNNVYLLGNDDENGVVGISGNPGVEELCDEITEPNEGAGRKKKVQCFDVDVINVRMFKKMTNGSVGGKGHAPVCALDKKQCKSLSLTITVDALSLLHRQTKVVNLYAVLVESAIRHLKLLEKAFLNNRELSQPQTFHFYPQECGHFVTKIYLKSNEEDSLLPERRKLHKQLLLDLARPQFRRNNKFGFKSENPNSGLLNNPHEGLKATDNGGKIALVKGKYAYYHYCQNKMDDNGWGCAYRSLQTLASWFKLQGYTDKDVPSFNDIQKCLVDIGDKPKNFIGSKQWIGSTEVNFVLNTLLGITCKILYVSSGEEMSSKGPELVSHFENHGSPVMIGGGVLAHTILGVDYNTQSGNIKFLILDPHYTGGEDLHTIQSKGWCGWKGVDFWDKTAYYNMCLPQVPVGI